MEDDSEEDNPSLVEPPSRVPTRKPTKPRQRKTPDREEVPIRTGNQYEHPKVPDIGDNSNPSLHSNNFKFQGMTQQQEVLLAVMNAQLNELKDEEQVLPDLWAKWVENASDILTGAPPHLPLLREVNHKIPLIDGNKQYNYHLPRCPDAAENSAQW